jgi:penicillin-binding protein 1A
MRKLLVPLLVVAALFSGVLAGLVQLYLRDLPQIRYLEEYRPSATTVIQDIHGETVGELYVEKRTPVRLNQIAPLFLKAIVAVEDERFYDHVGIDVKAVLRALWADIRHRSFVQGGSTITQQLTRNLFLESDKSLRRKIREAILAIQIENHYTKDEILELYCNQIYLGSGVYGVEAAARKYFAKPASSLTITEAALIAGLPKAPSSLDPLRFPDRAKKRREVVLRRMLDIGAIGSREYHDAREAPLGLAGHVPKGEAPYFIEYVRQYLEDRFGSAAIYERGLRVRTTLDLNLQREAERALALGLERRDASLGFREPGEGEWRGAGEPTREEVLRGGMVPAVVTGVAAGRLSVRAGEVAGTVLPVKDRFPNLPAFAGRIRPGMRLWVSLAGDAPAGGAPEFVLRQRPLLQGALVAVDPRNGHLRAMVGGYDFTASQFNRAVQARRQPGSSIKPFIYAAALEKGYTEASLIRDEPVRYPAGTGRGYWEPQNYDGEFRGDTTLLEALTLSRNVVTIKLLERLGVERVLDLIRRTGVESPMGRNLSLALGTSEVNLLELTSAYGTFGNGGIHCPPLAVLTVSDDRGVVLEGNEPGYRRVLEPEVAVLVTDMLRNVVLHGTGTVASRLPYPVAGKTGTTNDYQDAWFIGFSTKLAAGVWVGYDDNRSMGRVGTGGGMAGPIWTDFMEGIAPLAAGEEFVHGETVILREIDLDTGLVAGPACRRTRPAAFVRGTEPRGICRSRH